MLNKPQNIKSIVVTGVSRGIGKAICDNLLRKGNYKIFAITRDTSTLPSLWLEKNPNLVAITCDFEQEESFINAVKLIQQHETKIDYLINNAGKLLHKPFEAINNKELQEIFKINFQAPFFLIQQLLPLFNEHAHIVNIGSMGGFQGSVKFNGLSAYSASKAALANLTECLAVELESKKIKLNCLALGAVQTEMLAEAFPNYKAPLTPVEMAEFIIKFTTEGHQFFNGKIIPVSSTTP